MRSHERQAAAHGRCTSMTGVAISRPATTAWVAPGSTEPERFAGVRPTLDSPVAATGSTSSISPDPIGAHGVLTSADSTAYHSLRRRPMDRADRYRLGCWFRKQTPRSSLGEWKPWTGRPDP